MACHGYKENISTLEVRSQRQEMSDGLPKVTYQDWMVIKDSEKGREKVHKVENPLCLGIMRGLVRLDKKEILLLLCLSTWKVSLIYCSNLKTYLLCKSHFMWIPLHLYVILRHCYGIETFCLGSNTEHAVGRLILSTIWFSCDKNPT